MGGGLRTKEEEENADVGRDDKEVTTGGGVAAGEE